MPNPNPSNSGGQRGSLLPDDLISEILTWLPANYVGRFRCVSKLWLALTTEPGFILAHASRARTTGFFLFTSISGKVEHIPVDDGPHVPEPFRSFAGPDGVPPEFLDSCNGLVLLRQPQGSSSADQFLSVVNPLTGAHRPIPTPPEVMSMQLSLAFDPSVSLHFKVVSIKVRQSCGEDYVYMYIYSSQSGNWRLHSNGPARKYDKHGFYGAVVWNGCLVWHQSRIGFLCLDIRTEQTRWLPLPSIKGKYHCSYFGESGSHLHYIAKLVPEKQDTVTHLTHLDILEFRPDASGWFVLHKVDLSCIEDVYPEVNGWGLRVIMAPLCFLRGENRTEDRLLLSIPGKIVCFHLHDKSFSTLLSGLPNGNLAYPWQFFFPYARSLSSPAPCTPISKPTHHAMP